MLAKRKKTNQDILLNENNQLQDSSSNFTACQPTSYHLVDYLLTRAHPHLFYSFMIIRTFFKFGFKH